LTDADIGFGFKVLLVGSSGVGKTAAIQRFCLGRCPDVPAKTLCSQFYERAFGVTESAEPIEPMIWDTSGRENLHLLAADSFQNANVCLVCYSFVDRDSFDAVPQWVEKVKAIAPDAQVVLVENKVDLLDSGRVAFDEGRRMAGQLESPLFRVSVKEGLNLRPLFTYLAVTLHKRFLSSLKSLPPGSDAFFVATVDDRLDTERPTGESPPAGPPGGGCAVA